MRRVAVIGVGVTKFGKHERTSAELFAEAAADALLDAELPASAVQALYYGNVVGSETEHQLHTGPQAASILGIPAIPTTRFEAACASSHAAFRHAVMEIAAGVSDVVLVGGAERVLNVPTPESTEYFAYATDASWEQTLGLTFPGVFALIARAHMQRYGTTEAQMAAVAVKNHKHGALNPKAQFQKEITVEQVLQSPYVADPLKLLDCCPFTDGGAAVVLASEEVARSHRRGVWVLASAAASDWMRRGRGADEPRRRHPRQPVGRPQGQRAPDRCDGCGADRGDRHPATRRGGPASGGRRACRPHPHPRRQHRHRPREPVRP